MVLSDTAFGALAGVLSCISFGSFGVPVKDPKVIAAKVDPVIFQCYKTAACFLSSFLVLTYVEFKFTWWGVVGASIWVFNGIFAIMAIQMAGLGVSQALWSGLSIFVSYMWGAYIFDEPIKDYTVSLSGLLIMAVGIVGVGYVSTASQRQGNNRPSPLRQLRHGDEESSGNNYGGSVEEDSALLLDDDADGPSPEGAQQKYALRKRGRTTTGLICATYVGVANGSFMVPFKKVPNSVKGIEYLPSFGIGAMLVTVVIVAVYFSYLSLISKKPVPSFHWEVAHKPALLAGTLWSMGNFFSIYTTQYLGLAFGWPLVQCQLLISTTWGIVYFREITNPQSIALFAASALAVLAGVILLGLYGLG